MIDKAATVLVVGHDDVIQRSIVEHYRTHGVDQVYSNAELDLDCAIQPSVRDFYQEHRPDYVFLGSTLSGGIKANQERPAEFCRHNLQSLTNVMEASHHFGVKKMIYWGSSCVYPRDAQQPYLPEQLLTGALESTSEPYAIAKLSGIILSRSYRRQYGLNVVVAIPATVYGPGADTDLQQAHVMGALIHKFVEAKSANSESVTVWGSGKPLREFLHKDDFLSACDVLINSYEEEDVVNVGSGNEISIADLAKLIAEAAGYQGRIEFDDAMPDGAPRKILDNQRLLSLGWSPEVSMTDGVRQMVQWYQTERVS